MLDVNTPSPTWSNDDELRALLLAIVDRLERGHRHTPSSTIWTPLSYHLWLAGEWTFSQQFNKPFDWDRERWSGDGGFDFWLGTLLKVDVKTRSGRRCTVPQDRKLDADIVAFAHYTGDIINAKLIGWAWRHEVLAAPLIRFSNGGAAYHVERPHPIEDLHRIEAMERCAA